MFYLSEIDHTLRLPPHLLNLPLDKAIKGELEGLFLDKVIPNLGLCISVYDIHSIDGGFIFPGDGASTYTRRLLKWERFAHFYRAVKLTENKGLFKWDTGYKVQQHGTMKQVLPAYSLCPKMIFPLFLSLLRMNFEQLFEVKFRLIMFRPFVGEVIAAKLKESTENGLRLSLGFFDDIYVPSPLMPSPSHHVPDPVEKNQVKWIWDYGASTDQNESSDDIEPTFTVERDEEIRFRVQDVVYQSIPILKADQKEVESKEIQKEKLKKFPPMLITGYLDADGLGPVGWWRG